MSKTAPMHLPPLSRRVLLHFGLAKSLDCSRLIIPAAIFFGRTSNVRDRRDVDGSWKSLNDTKVVLISAIRNCILSYLIPILSLNFE